MAEKRIIRKWFANHKCEEQALAATSSLVLSLSGARRGEALRNSFHMAYRLPIKMLSYKPIKNVFQIFFSSKHVIIKSINIRIMV